jgi:hypothetical protein
VAAGDQLLVFSRKCPDKRTFVLASFFGGLNDLCDGLCDRLRHPRKAKFNQQRKNAKNNVVQVAWQDQDT